jgi:hypothetical protein
MAAPPASVTYSLMCCFALHCFLVCLLIIVQVCKEAYNVGLQSDRWEARKEAKLHDEQPPSILISVTHVYRIASISFGCIASHSWLSSLIASLLHAALLQESSLQPFMQAGVQGQARRQAAQVSCIMLY